MAAIKCPGCGREISSFAEKCNYCGHSISDEQQKQSTPGSVGTNQYQAKGRKSVNRNFVAIAILIIILLLAFIGRSEEKRLQQKKPHRKV